MLGKHRKIQLRYTIARLARKYLVDYIFIGPIEIKGSPSSLRRTLKEIKNMVAYQTKSNPYDCGVKAEFSVTDSLIESLAKKKWYETIIQDTQGSLNVSSHKIPALSFEKSPKCFDILKG